MRAGDAYLRCKVWATLDGADHPIYNTLRRISAYNIAATCATPGGSECNHQLFELSNADHTLIEDCAAAGRARSIAYAFQSSYTTWRRCWFRGDQGTGWSPSIADHDGYALRCRIATQIGQFVHDRNRNAADFDDGLRRQRLCPRATVVVAAHGG